MIDFIVAVAILTLAMGASGVVGRHLHCKEHSGIATLSGMLATYAIVCGVLMAIAR